MDSNATIGSIQSIFSFLALKIIYFFKHIFIYYKYWKNKLTSSLDGKKPYVMTKHQCEVATNQIVRQKNKNNVQCKLFSVDPLFLLMYM